MLTVFDTGLFYTKEDDIRFNIYYESFGITNN